MSDDATTATPKTDRELKKQAIKVAQVHSHFNIYRDIHESRSGPVTLDEQIKAAERFLRWHLRQVEVARLMLWQLHVSAGHPVPPAPPAPES